MEKLKYPKKTLIFTLEMPMKTLLFYSCFTVATLIINNIFAAICEMALVFAIRSLPLNSIKRKSTDHKKNLSGLSLLTGICIFHPIITWPYHLSLNNINVCW